MKWVWLVKHENQKNLLSPQPIFEHVSQALKFILKYGQKANTLLLTAAARSTCPGAVGGLTADPPCLGGAAGVGLGAIGIGGFPPTFGAREGLAPTIGGAGGLGLLDIGGGTLPTETLKGLEFSCDSSVVFFQGAAVPFAGLIPGKTETGLAKASETVEVDKTF